MIINFVQQLSFFENGVIFYQEQSTYYLEDILNVSFLEKRNLPDKNAGRVNDYIFTYTSRNR